MKAGFILGLTPANERRRNFVTTSLIGWAQTENQPCDGDSISDENLTKVLTQNWVKVGWGNGLLLEGTNS